MATYLNTQDALDVVVSCFANYNMPSNPKPIKMIAWLRSAKHYSTQERIRAEKDKARRDALKATLPAITPSGDFEYRSADKLKPSGHSGLIQFDIDLKDNPHIRNYADLKAQLAKLPFVAYCGLSVSGTGYWGLVPISNPERHGQHFDALKRVFAHYHIILDEKPRNVASLRGYSYDPEGYFAKQVMLFELYDVPKPPPARSVDYSRFGDEDDSNLLARLVRFTKSAGEGDRHATLLKAARLAGGFVAAGRLDEQNAIYALETVASEWPMFFKSQKTIRDGIKYGLTAPIYPEERTTPLKINAKTTKPLTGKTGKSPDAPTSLRPDATADRVATPVESTIAESTSRIQPTVRKAESEMITVVVDNLDDWADNPGSILRPPESSLERSPVVEAEYPADWDEPSPVEAVPTIKEINYFEWQRKYPPFNQLGLASLQANQQPA